MKEKLQEFIQYLKSIKPNWSCEEMKSTSSDVINFIQYLKGRKPNWSCEHMAMVVDDYIALVVEETNRTGAKTKLTVNIFIKRPGFYKAYITTLDDLPFPYDRKFTLTLYEAMDWKDGTYCGAAGSAKIHDLSRYDNEYHYYANTVWDYMHKEDKHLYKAILKEYVSETLTEIDLDRGMFLFTRPIR